MSVSSEDVTHVDLQLFNDMMSKFGEFTFLSFLCCHDSIFSENEESPPFVGYDMSHLTVFFTILKWYLLPSVSLLFEYKGNPPYLLEGVAKELIYSAALTSTQTSTQTEVSEMVGTNYSSE